MHITTHILSGWVVGNLVSSFGPRERFFCMVAASAPDFDGLSLLGGWDCYCRWHHVVLHNLPFALALSVALAVFSKPKRVAFPVYLGLVHLHFLMDLLGSGTGWGIAYLWPFSTREYPSFGWEFFSWQNYLALLLVLAASVGLVYWKKRTIFEYPLPKIDREVTGFFVKLLPRRS